MPRPELSISFAGLVEPGSPWIGGTRAKIDWAARAGFRWVHLDAAAPDARARDLSRTARRDLASAIRRAGLGLSGLDLWIPPAHFAGDSTVGRALDAADQALELALELGTLVGSARASVSLQIDPAASSQAFAELARRAERRGARVANTTWPIADSLTPWIGPGLDPAAAIIAGGDPVLAASAHAERLVIARLSDSHGPGRLAPLSSSGRLDLEAYAAALDAGGYNGPIVLDLREVADQPSAASRVTDRWSTSL